MSTGYYQHEADFECDPIEEYIFPPDIKRIISHGDHTFHRQLYFFSPSAKKVFRFSSYEYGMGTYLTPGKKYNLITDDNKHDMLYISDKLLERTANMTKIILPKMR
ncbi:hypothetical protein M9Y10_007116 [Tritrichomonas musculus]|uniref:Uncharacterized protein n=1 Tax=Tritrichomonas musculus TaxID=1915356 RepID=A0ABR2J1F6_9EUKA